MENLEGPEGFLGFDSNEDPKKVSKLLKYNENIYNAQQTFNTSIEFTIKGV